MFHMTTNFHNNYIICEVTELKVKYLNVVGQILLKIFAILSRPKSKSSRFKEKYH